MTGTEDSVGSGVRERWVRSEEAEGIPGVLLLSLVYSILLRKETGDLEFMSPARNSLCTLSLGST